MQRPSFLRALRHLGIGLIAVLGLGVVAAEAEGAPAGWIVEGAEARALLADGALLLDTRDEGLRGERSIEGAMPVAWQTFSQPDLPTKGRLLDDDAELTDRLRALGVSQGVPVVVVADSKAGWGEDGRIVWTLRSLGHSQSYLVNGGIDALLRESVSVQPVRLPGNFTVARTDAYDITRQELAGLIGRPDVVILDTREPREYQGETPYGEARGGHVPGARHLYFRDLVGADGKVLAGDALRERLSALGVGEGTEVVSYCTGGIRSGFVTSVLADAGIKARNYSGSMWDWASGDAQSYPLVSE